MSNETRVVQTWDELPPVVSDGGEHFSTRVLERKYRELENQLEQWRSLGNQLWPYCRFWGLFGAELPAVLAATELARLLGHDTSQAIAAQAASDATVDTVERIATWMTESGWIRRMAPDAREKFLKELRGLVKPE